MPFPTPEDLPDSGIRLSFLASPSLTGRFLATIVTCKRVQWFGGLVAKSCLTDRNPMDYSLPGSSVHGILWARTLDGLPFASPGDLPNPGIEPGSPELQADSLPIELQGKPVDGIGRVISPKCRSNHITFLLKSLQCFSGVICTQSISSASP